MWRIIPARSATNAEKSAARRLAGRRAENVAVDYLFLRGYIVLAQNLRLGRSEIDIVARRGELIALVEVRSRGRTSFQRGLESIAGAKQKQLLIAAARYAAGPLRTVPGAKRLRIDVASVDLDSRGIRIEYIEGAISREVR